MLRTGLFCKSRPAKTVEEVTSIQSLPKITSFFKPDADNVLELPDDAVPVVHPDDPVIFEEVSSALTRDNLVKFIEYMFSRREQSSHFNSLLLRKAILHYVSLNSNNIKQSARPVQEVTRRRERRPYSAEQLEVLQNELLLAIRRKNKDIADEISCLNGSREVSTEDVRNWMSSKRHAARNAVPE